MDETFYIFEQIENIQLECNAGEGQNILVKYDVTYKHPIPTPSSYMYTP